MGAQFEGLTDRHKDFIAEQHVFFVATAARDGRVNVSPKGLDALDIDLVQTSCGYGVPFMEFTGDRPLMDSWAEKKGPEGLHAYQQEKNRVSLDGMPTGLPS